MPYWKNITVKYSINLLIMASLLITTLPTDVLTSIILFESPQEKNNDIFTLKNSDAHIKIPRLTNDTIEALSTTKEMSDIQNGNEEKTPSFSIGEQTGTGGGSYSISDSFNWTGTEIIDTQNEINIIDLTPTDRQESMTIIDPSSYTKLYMLFNMSNIQAELDWRLIEKYISGTSVIRNSKKAPPDTTPTGNEWLSIAISFEIKEDFVNLSGIQTYTQNGGSGTPTGTVWIEGDNSGEPNGTRISSLENLNPAGNGWNEYEFNDFAGHEYLLLPQGTYYVIMNDTDTTQDRYWNWYVTRDDQGDGNNNTVHAMNSYGGSWWNCIEFGQYFDAPLQLRVQPVEQNSSGHWIAKHYNLTNDIKIWYNTTANGGSEVFLDNSAWFKANDTATHLFKSNTSISFNLNLVANYTYSSTISSITTYKAQNNTATYWNITFDAQAINQTYSITNRLIQIIDLPINWNATQIYWNESLTPEYTDLTNNDNVTTDGNPANKYTNGSATMVVNASALAVNTTWHVWFEAPNYLTSYNWQISNSNVITATTMDKLESNYSFITPNTGGFNFSVWIESPSGSVIYSDIDNNLGDIIEDWNITETAIALTEANGTYQTYAFWENTTSNQIGLFIRNITVYVHTTFFVEAPTEVLEDTWLNITVHYNTTHNNTGVNSGNVTGVPGWTQTPVQFDQMISFGSYNLSIYIDSGEHSPGDQTNVTIYAEMPWHQNHTKLWNITIVFDSSFTRLDVPENLLLEYGQTYLLRVNYSSGNSFISGASMTVDGDNENFTEESNYYSYELITTRYNSGEFKENLVIILSHPFFRSQTMVFNLTITPGPTTLHQAYLPIIPSIYYTENYSFPIFFNSTVDNEGILNADYTTSHSSAIDFWYFNSSGYYFFNLSSSYLSLGSSEINITLNHANYQTSSILLTFNIIEMPTQPLDSYSISNDHIMVEETISISINDFQTYKSEDINTIDNVLILLNDSSIDSHYILFSKNIPFSVELDTTGIQYGKYNMTVVISTYGYESQATSFNVSIDGYETGLEIEIEPGKNVQQGEDVIFIATLSYIAASAGGYGTSLAQTIPLENVEILFHIVLLCENGTARTFEETVLTSRIGQSIYTIEGQFTKAASGFSNITIIASPSLSGLPAFYSMSSSDLESYKILPTQIDIFEVIVMVLIGVVALLISAVILSVSVRTVRRRRTRKKQLVLRHDIAVEKSFEDIKSIRLIIARHESGLQFYSEKTIAEIQTDTDALSGMSAALSTFMEEISDSMVTSPEQRKKDQIEVVSREGLHMLIWHGRYSSLIVISEVRLPDYFQGRLKLLGNELEAKFQRDLEDFYSTDQIPSNIVKKMVRKYIPLHYFSAFVLNEGVLTLKSIKLNKKEKKMLKHIKKIRFEKGGISYFFSEQIISHLSQRYKRSEAIEWLDRAIDINLLVEASQEDLISLHTIR